MFQKITVEKKFKATEVLVFHLIFRLSKLNMYFQITQAFPGIAASQNTKETC